MTATFLRENGTTIVKSVMVPAQSRVNLAVTGAGSDVPELANERFGTLLESTQPIIVERSMYTDANGCQLGRGHQRHRLAPAGSAVVTVRLGLAGASNAGQSLSLSLSSPLPDTPSAR